MLLKPCCLLSKQNVWSDLVQGRCSCMPHPHARWLCTIILHANSWPLCSSQSSQRAIVRSMVRLNMPRLQLLLFLSALPLALSLSPLSVPFRGQKAYYRRNGVGDDPGSPVYLTPYIKAGQTDQGRIYPGPDKNIVFVCSQLWLICTIVTRFIQNICTYYLVSLYCCRYGH